MTQLRAVDVVQVEGLRRAYDGRSVISGLDLSIAPGEFVVLLGRSGCGKTTLLRTLAGLDRPDGGRVEVPRRRAVVFQEPRLLPWRRVWQNVALGLGRGQRENALRALDEVGLADHADAWPATLSGGEAQRVALARSLMREPQLLLLDEPFAALDALTRIRMHGLVEELCRRHRPATVLVTHDVDEAIALADRIAVMASGTLAREIPVDLPRPRERGTAAGDALRRELLAELGVGGPGPVVPAPLGVGR